MTSWNGDVVCLACANEAVGMLKSREQRYGYEPPPRRPRHGAPADEDEERMYLRELGLKPPTDWEEIESTYKTLLRKWHPDKAADESERKSHEQKFKKIRTAFDWLAVKYNKAA
jgi:DnaJ-domain-containing protein 1